MYVSPIVLIYLSSHLSFWLTISLFYKSVSVFFSGNMFIGSNLSITGIYDIIGYLSFPFDILTLIWLFLGSSVVLKTALFIFFTRLVFHSVRVPLLVCPFICLWTVFLLSCLGYFNIAAVHICLPLSFRFWWSYVIGLNGALPHHLVAEFLPLKQLHPVFVSAVTTLHPTSS